jgi:hypothetical protein
MKRCARVFTNRIGLADRLNDLWDLSVQFLGMYSNLRLLYSLPIHEIALAVYSLLDIHVLARFLNLKGHSNRYDQAQLVHVFGRRSIREDGDHLHPKTSHSFRARVDVASMSECIVRLFLMADAVIWVDVR